MAGMSGKSAWVAGAKQTAKGTPATLPIFKNAFAGGSIGPVRDTDRLAETDAARDQGAAFVTTGGVEGSPEVYVRPDSIGLYLLGAFGSNADTGTTPNFTHTYTPGNTLPYMTFWKNVGGAGAVIERYDDCMVGSLTVSAEAGQPLSATAAIQGLNSTRLTTDPTSAVLLDAESPFNYNLAAVTLGGSAIRSIRSFEFTIENNLTRQQTDDVIPYDVVPGTREVSLGFDMLFENLNEYNSFHYGTTSGTILSPNIYTTSASFTFTIDANTEISFTLPSIAYEEFPVEPDPGGDPIVVAVRAVGQRATGVTNLVTAVLKNNVATY